MRWCFGQQCCYSDFRIQSSYLCTSIYTSMILPNILTDILDRQIYHCPYCNLCRLGKGLGIDYFHCMKCNACMSNSLFIHVCREKCLEDNCPICNEYIFTSNSPVKQLPCGHLMHSSCFQVYRCSKNYLVWIYHSFFLRNSHLIPFYPDARTTLALSIFARSVASHWGTCRLVYIPLFSLSELFPLPITL